MAGYSFLIQQFIPTEQAVSNSLKHHLAVLLLLAYVLAGIIHPSQVENVKHSGQADFLEVAQIDSKSNFDYSLAIQFDNLVLTKSKQFDYQFEFTSLFAARVAAGLFFDLAFTSWLKKFHVFFYVFQILYPFHHFW